MRFINDLRLGFGRRLPSILQIEASECSLACLAMVMTYYGYQTNMVELRKRFPISLKGASLDKLVEIADHLGMTSRPVRLELSELVHLQVPAILHWDLNHFVVLKKMQGNWGYVHDPAVGAIKLSLQQISKHFTGVALELTPGLQFQRKAPPPPIQLRQLTGRIVGLKRSLFQLLGLAVVLEALALTTPVITQWITDEAIVRADRNLLTMLGIGVILIGLSSVMIGAVRSWIGIYISSHFNLQWMSNVMGRLLKLPVEYFERRHLGDIVSRFGAVHAIEQGMTSAVVDVVLDGLLAVGTLSMMLIYSPTLAAMSVIAVTLYGLLRWARYDSVKMASVGLIAQQAREQTYFLETVRGVRAIKLFNREEARRAGWLTLWVNAMNASLGIQRLNLFFDASRGGLSVLERAGIWWIGAVFVMNQQLSLGMLFAFLTYKEQFSMRVNGLIDRWVELSMLGIQAERLADIVLTSPEDTHSHRRHALPDDITLSLNAVTYRYAMEDTYVLQSATLVIKPGECVAIVGASGCGKTTCLKLVLGILKPAYGKISLGGLSIAQLGLHAYRELISTVMQDDHLFAGSLYDNICFLDSKPDETWLHDCAKTAGIHDEIISMPMGYHTLVGDMGTTLSGGQKQRVLLARALYRRPKILLLDEATSHLDINNERKISQAIASLNITRIMIAHRPETIAIADRVVCLERGRFVEEARQLSPALA